VESPSQTASASIRRLTRTEELGYIDARPATS
jgi:hypothetical protein